MNHIIFDFDGVLARSLEDNTNMNLKFNKFPGMTRTELDQMVIDRFSQPRHDRSKVISEVERQEILDFSVDIANMTLACENTIFQTFIDSIKKLTDCRFAIVSSGSELYVKKYSSEFGINFDYVLTVEDSLSKEDKVETVCQNWGIEVKECNYITDTVSDVLELREIMDKNKILGVAWGWSGLDRLKKVLPENQILVDQQDILKYFN